MFQAINAHRHIYPASPVGRAPGKPAFGTQGVLLQQFGVDPAQVAVVASPGVPVALMEQYKPVFLEKLLSLHQVAKANQMRPVSGNHSGYYFTAEAILENGKSYMGINGEGAPWKTVCAEQAALLNAETDQRFKPSANGMEKPPKITWLLMANQQFGVPVSPCPECLDWMRDGKAFAPNTTVVTLRRDPANGRLFLHAQTVRDILANTMQHSPSLSYYDIGMLPVTYTPNAYRALVQKGLTLDTMKALMNQAKQAYLTTKTAVSTQKNQGASVLVGGNAYSAAKLEWWSPRFTENPDIMAAVKGVQDCLQRWTQHWMAWSQWLGNIPPWKPRVEAVAYFGEDPAYPKPSSLGRLMYPHWGGRDTLVLTLRHNTLNIHTAEELLNTDYFQSQKLPLVYGVP